MEKSSLRSLILSGLFLALGLLLPFLTGQIPEIGKMFLPMHLPVLLCGFICGWPYGLAIGFITPLLRSVLFGMPFMFPVAVCMALELASYGLISGLLFTLMPKNSVFIYLTLVLSMIGGRIVWGIASYFLYGLSGTSFTWELFVSGALVNAIPGIILQMVLVPLIVISLKRNRKFLESSQI